MPENSIGLIPDNAWAYLSTSVLPEGVGRLMAMTGCTLVGAGDVVGARLASHHVPTNYLPALVDSLMATDLEGGADKAVLNRLADYAVPMPPAGRLKAEAALLREIGA